MPAPTILSTRSLLQRVQDKDPEAQRKLFEVYQPRLLHFVHGRLPSEGRPALESIDLVQEIWLRACRSLEHFEPEGAGAFWAWLRRIARNALVDQYRKPRPTAESLVDADGSNVEVPGHGTTPPAAVLRKEEEQHLEHALDELAERDKRAILLRLEVGLSFEEIAVDGRFPTADAARKCVTRTATRLSKRLADLASHHANGSA